MAISRKGALGLVFHLALFSFVNAAVVKHHVPATHDEVLAQTTNDLNVPQAQSAQPGTSQYQNYQSVVQLLKQGLNTKVNPCDDFYGYTCGNFNAPMSFSVSDNDNFNKMAQQMQDQSYVSNAPAPVKQVVAYFNQCQYARANWDKLVANGAIPAKAINTLMAGDASHPVRQKLTAGNPFPMYDQTNQVTAFPNSMNMGFLLGYPTGLWGVSSLVSAYVDTNWKNPQSGYALFIDQPTTMLPYTYYVKAWNTYQPILVNNVIYNMNAYAKSQNRTLDQQKLLKDAKDIVAFDYMLAMNFSTDETTRRQSERNYNPMTISQMEMQYNNIDWFEFIPTAVLPSASAAQVTVNNPNYNYIVMEPAKLEQLNNALVTGNKYGITPNVVLNYIYYSVLSSQADYLPSNSLRMKVRDQLKEIPVKRMGKRHSSSVIPQKRKFERKQMDDVSAAAQDCAAETMEMIQYANARVFIDKIYPTNSSRTVLRNSVAKIASSILIGFRSMIDQLDWMSSSTKKGAYNKIENLVKNVAYPDWITDDNQLTEYHATLGITSNDDYFTMVQKANTFNLFQMWESLNQAATNRLDFNGPPGTTNAWYQPELNSITFPAAILRQPFFDINWPAAVNFGGLGVISGHELTHGFDDEGVQWDGIGELNNWMDSTSQVSFNQMANCVINEYSNFCPLNKTVYGQGACVDGAQTQGENIADNGGIHAAFRAYKNYINLDGPDPRLPDTLLQEFTADQLFFLSFAQVWCQLPPSSGGLERQILVDPHSPSIYRVWGTIQNFPAFKDAFNCPSSAYAPDQHCNVWVSDISSSYGLPNNN